MPDEAVHVRGPGESGSVRGGRDRHSPGDSGPNSKVGISNDRPNSSENHPEEAERK